MVSVGKFLSFSEPEFLQLERGSCDGAHLTEGPDMKGADHEARGPRHSVLVPPSPRPYRGAKPHRLMGQADTEVDVKAHVPARLGPAEALAAE